MYDVGRITSKPHSVGGLPNSESGLEIQPVARATGQGGGGRDFCKVPTPLSSIMDPPVPDRSSPQSKRSRIPSIQTLSFREATKTTKNTVIARDHRRCWLCLADWQPNLDVVYNIGVNISLERVCSSFLISRLRRRWIPLGIVSFISDTCS